MPQKEHPGRPSRRRLVMATGLVATALVVVIAAASTLGSAGPNYTPLGTEGASAVALVGDQLRADCLNLEQATELLSSALAKAGVPSGYAVRTDGGIMSSTEEGDWEAVLAHLEAGCYTYSGTGHNALGRRIFYLSGSKRSRRRRSPGRSEHHAHVA